MRNRLVAAGAVLLLWAAPAMAGIMDDDDDEVVINGHDVKVPGVTIKNGKVTVDGVDMNAGKGDGVTTYATPGSKASAHIGTIDRNVDVQGVTVINGDVTIDGQHVPRDAKRFKARNGTVYRIDRSNGGVSVTTE